MADSVKIKIDGDDKGFRKTLEGISGVAKTSFKTIAVGAAAVGSAFTAITAKALNFAGELEQNIGGSEAVFKEFASTMQDTANTAYKNMGLSASNYLATANKMGALMQGSGIGIKESADLSAKAMQRAADVASIMGIDVSFAMESIAGAAKGNFTMMDNLGVAMNATTLEAYALSKGITTAYANMDNATKVQLAMEMFLEKTTYAAGNYAKENKTLAGALTTAKAALTNFMSGTGSVNDVVESLTDAADVISDNIVDLVPKLAEGFGGIASKLVPKIPDMFEKMLPGMDKGINILLSSLTDSAPEFANVAAKLIKSFASAIIKNMPNLASAGKEIISALLDGVGDIVPVLQPATNVLKLLTDNLDILIPSVLAAVIALKGFSVVSSISTWFNTAKDAVIIYNAALRAQAAGATLTKLANDALTAGLSASQLVVGLLTGQMKLAEVATYALAAAKKALSGATGLVIAGIAALAVGIVAWIKKSQEASEEEKALQKRYEETRKTVDELAEAEKNRREQVAEQLSQDLSSVNHTKALADELYLLADANGYVQESDRERAEFLLGELNKAMGTEIKMIDGQIQKYGELQAAVKQTIETKRYEALMSASEKDYTAAVQKIDAAIAAQTKAYNELLPVQEKYLTAKKTMNELLDGFNAGTLTEEQAKAFGEASKIVAENKENYEKLKTTYENATATAQKHSEAIVEYETAQAIAMSEGAAAASQYLTERMRGEAAVATATEASGKKSASSLQVLGSSYQNNLQKLSNALATYEEDGSEAAKGLVIQALTEVQNSKAEFEAAGGLVGMGYIAGMGNTPVDISSLTSNIEGKLSEFSQNGETFGLDFTTNFANGIISDTVGLEEKLGELASNLGTGFPTTVGTEMNNTFPIVASSVEKESEQVGYQVDAGIAAGLEKGKPLVNTKVQEIADSIPDGMKKLLGIQSPSRVMRDKVGKMASAGVAVGMEEGFSEVTKVLYESNETLLESEQFYLDESLRMEREKEEAEYQERLASAKNAKEIEKIKQERLKKQQEEADEAYLDGLKETAEREREICEARKKDVLDTFETMWDNASEILDEFEDRQSDFGKSLKDSINLVSTSKKLITSMPGYHTGSGVEMEVSSLTDMGKQLDDLKVYGERLKKLEGLVPEDLYREILSYDPEEATQFMNAFFGATKEQQQEYISKWQEIPETIKGVTNSAFKNEGEEIRTMLTDAFGELPENFFGIGADAAKEFGTAFMEQLSQMLSTAKQTINASFVGMLPGAVIANGAFAGVGTTIYEDNRTTTIYANDVTAHDIVEEQNQNEIRQSHTRGWG
ncbi:MAG: hypothetical protein IJ300_14135 [Clostridia bacterium]|nr:hypothetical protein [Clostridia bacterium]